MSRTVAWNKLLIKHSRERKLVVNASPSPTGNLKRTRTRNESEAARLDATLRLFLDIVVVEMRRVVYYVSVPMLRQSLRTKYSEQRRPFLKISSSEIKMDSLTSTRTRFSQTIVQILWYWASMAIASPRSPLDNHLRWETCAAYHCRTFPLIDGQLVRNFWPSCATASVSHTCVCNMLVRAPI